MNVVLNISVELSRRHISSVQLSQIKEDSSELTHGLNQVICGNPVRALRARKGHNLPNKVSHILLLIIMIEYLSVNSY